MANCLEAFLDKAGEYSSIDTNSLYDFKTSPLFLLGWVHSSVFNMKHSLMVYEWQAVIYRIQHRIYLVCIS